MINLLNNSKMTREMRVNSLKRALMSQPFFTNVAFPIGTGTAKENQYGQQLNINRDFYLTQISANFGEVAVDTGGFFNMSVYTGYQKSVYKFDSQQPLPSGFISSEARFRTPVVNQVFDDKQREMMPVLIKNGDKVYVDIFNTTAKTEVGEAIVMLGGFQINQMHIDSRSYGQLQNSLDKDSKTSLDYFKFDVEEEGKQTFTLKNDSFPRTLLGFGVTNSTADKSLVSESNILITDTTRYIQFSNKPLPLQFIAPRLTCLLDTHIYYLPIEYYLQPFAKLQFDLSNTAASGEEITGYKLNMLTRTV